MQNAERRNSRNKNAECRMQKEEFQEIRNKNAEIRIIDFPLGDR